MKGIILAGGTGSRLYPLTRTINKHLLPVGKYPMIYHAVFKLRLAGITDILIVSGKSHLGEIINHLGSGHEWGLNLTYKAQDQPGGIAQALGAAEDFAKNDSMVVLLGDNIFSDDLKPAVLNFQKQAKGAKILVKKVRDPHRYGVVKFTEDKIAAIEEKPDIPPSHYAVTGIYMYDSTVFEIIKSLKPSKRGELEITDVNNVYIQRNELTYDIFQGWWIDAGTHHSFFLANRLAKNIDWSL